MTTQQKQIRASGIRVSPAIQFEGGRIISVKGPFDEMMDYIAVNAWNPRNLVAIGQNGHIVKEQIELEAHAIYIVDDKNIDVASIETRLIKALKQDGFDYTHLIAGLEGGIEISIFGTEFNGNPYGKYVAENFYRAFFTPDGVLKFDDERTNTLLLIGNEGERTIVGQITERTNTFKVIANPNNNKVQARHVIVDNAVLTVGFGTKTIYGIDTEMIKTYLTGKTDKIKWTNTTFDYGIEDIALVGGVENTVIVTVQDKNLRLIPAIVRFEDRTLKVVPSIKEGVKLDDLGGEIVSPVVRVTTDGRVILTNPTTTLHFDLFTNFGKTFENMITRATRGQLAIYAQ